MNVTYYLCILLGQTFETVDDEKADVGAADGVEGAHYGIILDVVFDFGLFAYACRIDYRIRPAVVGELCIYGVAGGARDIGHY